MGKTE